MKSLIEFIKEAESPKSKDFTFNFDGVDNAEDLVKSLSEYDTCVSVDDKKVTVTVKDGCDNCSKVQELLQQAIQYEQDGTRTSNDEQYAQKVKSLANKLSEMEDFMDELENPDNEESKKDEKSKKEKDKKEDE